MRTSRRRTETLMYIGIGGLVLLLIILFLLFGR